MTKPKIIQIIPNMKAESGGPVRVLLSYKSILDRIGVQNNVIQTDEKMFPNLLKFVKKYRTIYFSHCIWDIQVIYILFSHLINIFFSHGMLAKKLSLIKLEKKIFFKFFYMLINIMKINIILEVNRNWINQFCPSLLYHSS